MSGYIGLGAFGVFLIIHIIALAVTAAYGHLLGPEVAMECSGIPAAFCAGPFEGMATVLNNKGINFIVLFQLAAQALPTLISVLVIDYDIFKGGGEIAGAIGLMIRAVGWGMIASLVVALGIQFFGR